MKDSIINFLDFGVTWQLAVSTVPDVLKALPFFEYIIDIKDQHFLFPNNNWFWASSNEYNRQSLITDLGFVTEFEKTDASYNMLLEKFEQGKYGIMRPALRLWTVDVPDDESYGIDLLLDLEKYPERERYNDKKYRYKLKYCLYHRLSFKEFEMWLTLENILGFPLNYAEALVADKVLYGDLSELKAVYMTSEYRNIKASMHAAVLVHKGNLKSLVDFLVEKYLDAYADDNWTECNDIQEQLYALCEVPEGLQTGKDDYVVLGNRCREIFDEYPSLPF